MINKKFLFLGLFLGLMSMLTINTSVASAAEFRIGKDSGGVTLGSEEIFKNLYTAGNILLINSKVEKSLHAAGNSITINGDVEGSVCVAGSVININGNVGGSVHAAGGTIIIDGNITDDLFLAGGNMVISKSASVGGDLFVGAGTIDIQGPIAGKVYVGAGAATINSKIGGVVKIEADKLIIGESAEIVQNLNYTSPEEAKISSGAKIFGTIDFNQRKIEKIDRASAFKGIFTAFVLTRLLALIALGLVLVYFFRRFTKPVVKNSLKDFWASLGIGFAALFLTPILGIISLITVVGLWLAGLIFSFYIFVVMISSSLASIAFGSWLMRMIKKSNDYETGWQQVVLGAIALMIIGFVPIVGWLVCFAFFLIGLGSIFRLGHQLNTKK